MSNLTNLYECASGVAIASSIVDLYDPLPHGYPVNVPGVSCTVSPDNPDRARLSIDRGDLRLHIEFGAKGWAPMRPARQTLIEQAEDQAYHFLGIFEDSQLESEAFTKLAAQLADLNIHRYAGPAWNPLPEDGWIEIEYWFERLAGAR